jgi:aspartyl-tRNA synthetase
MAQALDVLNVAEVLPFPVDDPEAASKVNEELRPKYRYLDLRRAEMARNLPPAEQGRHGDARVHGGTGLSRSGTPLLFKSTPEGARVHRAEPARAGHGLRSRRNRRSSSNKS